MKPSLFWTLETLEIVEVDALQLELDMLVYRLECGLPLGPKCEGLWNCRPRGLHHQEKLMQALGLAEFQLETMLLKLRDSHINVADVIWNAAGAFVGIE